MKSASKHEEIFFLAGKRTPFGTFGHPLAAPGARITLHLSYELERRGAKYGVGSACIGGGQGIAVLVEAM